MNEKKIKAEIAKLAAIAGAQVVGMNANRKAMMATLVASALRWSLEPAKHPVPSEFLKTLYD